MAKILCVEDAVVYLRLCESDDEEFQSAVGIIVKAYEEQRDTANDLRQNMITKIEDQIQEKEAAHTRTIRTLGDKITELQDITYAVGRALYGEEE